jgi:hypothetical protein
MKQVRFILYFEGMHRKAAGAWGAGKKLIIFCCINFPLSFKNVLH